MIAPQFVSSMPDLTLPFRLRLIEQEHPAYGVAMPVLSYHDGVWRCLGSSFFVVPGLAITAAHLVREWVDTDQAGTNRRAAVPVVAIQFIDGKPHEWRAEFVDALWPSDIALLRFARPSWWGNGPGQKTA